MYYNLKHVVKNYWFFLLALCAMFVLFFGNMNHALFFYINAHYNLAPDDFWIAIIAISGQKVILCAFLFVLTYSYKRDKAYNVALLIVTYFVVFYLIKINVHEARPYIQYNPLAFHWLHQADMFERAYLSFPSGHTGVVAIVVFAIVDLFLQKKTTWVCKILKITLMLFLGLTMLAQICTGWHFPLDVMGSGLIGYFLVAVII